MVTLRIPTNEEIRIAAWQGEDAVVALVGGPLQVIALLAQRVRSWKIG